MKQRILIARAIYRESQYFFLDEATSSLDTINERLVQQHLQRQFKGKTVVIIAHRLSTVQTADQIVVLTKGMIVEIGSHNELIERNGEYYRLV